MLFAQSNAYQDFSTNATISLSVEEAVQYAKNNSAQLKVSAIDLELKRWSKNVAWNSLLPSVTVSGTMSRANKVTDQSAAIQKMINPLYKEPEITEKDHWSAVGSLSVSLNLNAALVQGIRATRANYEAGLVSYETSEKELERDVRKMFYSLLLMQENAKLQKELLENARRRAEQSNINYKNGMIPELSLLQAQVAYETQKPAIVETEQSINQQLATFGFLLGIPYGTKITLRGKIDPVFLQLDANALVQQHLENRLDIANLRQNINATKLSLSATKLQTYTPSLSLSYNYQPIIKEIDKKWFDKDNIMDNGSFSGSIAMNLTNVLPFSQAQQNIKTTDANIKKMELQLAQARQNAEIEIHNLVASLEKSKAQLSALEYNVQLAKKSYTLASRAYKSGTKELLEVRDAESQLGQAQLGILQEKFTYISTLLDLEYALNTKLSTQ